ncbi:MAG: hypothetical protein B7X11_04960, partial [Acidobacteria bacterium 37-65-4]
LLIGAMLAVVIGGSTWGVYRNHARAEKVITENRLSQVAEELSLALDRTSRQLLQSTDAAARNSAVRAYLEHPGPRLRGAALGALFRAESGPQTVTVQLWDTAGHVLLNTEPDHRVRAPSDETPLLRRAAMSASGAVGRLHVIGDSVVFAVVSRVRLKRRVTGYVVLWRVISSSPDARRAASLLIGDSGRILVGNATDSVWSDLEAATAAPPVNLSRTRGVVTYQRPRIGRVLAMPRRVAGTPWTVVVEFPYDSIMAPMRDDASRLLLIDAFVLLLGLLSRLTAAVESTAAGGAPSPAAHPAGGDELIRLGHAFDAMVARVDDALAARTASEEEYRRLFESVPLPAYVFDVESLRFLEVNGAAVRHYGYSREAFLSMTLRDIRSAEDVPRMEADVRILNDRPQARGIWRHLKHDGTPIDVEVISHRINFNGRPAALTVVTDVTERNAAADALRLSEERYRSLFREAPFGIALSSVEGRIVDANPALASMLGYASEREIVGRHVVELYADPDDRNEIFAELQRTGHCRREALQWMRQDGRPITARFTARVVFDARHPNAYVEAIVENVTERVRLEEQFRQAQKMEAIGRLAGGIAHDFNNLLTVILATTELLLDRSPAAGPEHAELEDVYRSAQRGADLTRQLLAFSRRQMLSVHPLSANTLVRG